MSSINGRLNDENHSMQSEYKCDITRIPSVGLARLYTISSSQCQLQFNEKIKLNYTKKKHINMMFGGIAECQSIIQFSLFRSLARRFPLRQVHIVTHKKTLK